MRVVERDGGLEIQDSPGLHWLLGLLFVGVGAVTFLLGAGITRDTTPVAAWQRALAAVLGGVGVAAGLWLLRRSSYSRASVDRRTGRVRIVRLGLGGRRATEWPLAAVTAVRLVESKDDEGGAMFQIHLVLRDGSTVPVSELWAHGRESLDAVVTQLAAVLAVPRT